MKLLSNNGGEVIQGGQNYLKLVNLEIFEKNGRDLIKNILSVLSYTHL